MKFLKPTLFVAALSVAACGQPADPDGGMGVDVPSGVDVPNVTDRPNADRPNPNTDRPNPPPTDVPTPDPDAGVCPMGTEVCGMAGCVNTQTDPANCGMCGNACPMGQMCSMGACMPSCMMPEVACGMGAGARCANLQTDTANCGACGTQCGMGQSCAAGVCTCPMGTTTCGMGAMATCVNAQTDVNNCGMCGNVCPMGNTCVAGVCTPPCAAPRMMCGMNCTDTQTDRNNCGACGNACPMAQSCVAGACACPMGQSACGMGAGLTCVNQQTDRANCGGCGVACGMAQSCNAGSCACPMATPNACGMGAAATCVNFQTDAANCGRCGNACAMGLMCLAGACVPTCNAPNILCGAAPNQMCINSQNDANNCGACGNACGANGACMAGACNPRNSTPATAIAIPLPATIGQRVTVQGNNQGGASAAGQCDQRGVYYSVTVTAPTILYVDTFGSPFDTRVGIRPMGAAATTGCIDDSCGTTQSQTTLVVPAGTHLIEVSGFNGATGPFTLNVAAIPASNGGRNLVIAPDGTRQVIRGNTAAMGNAAIAVPGLGNKKADVYYYLTCPAAMASTLNVDTCYSAFDTMLSIVHGGIAMPTNATDDDGGDATCGFDQNSSNLGANAVPAGAGIHAIYATGFSTAEGLYSVHFSTACANNQVLVGTTCTPIQNLLTDAANCGAPGRACPAMNTCAAGVCVAAGGNTNPPALTYAVSEGTGTALANIGGPGGNPFSDACPAGTSLIGIRTSEGGPFGGMFGTTLIVGHVEGICGTMSTLGLTGTAPQRVTFTRAAPNLPVRGAVAMNPREILCPAGHTVVGVRGATNGTVVDALTLLCAPVTIAGNGPFTVAVGTALNIGAAGGEGNAATQVVRTCPAGQVANGIVGRVGSGLDAVSVLCHPARVFQVQINTGAGADLPATGGNGGGAYADNCPANNILVGAGAEPVVYLGEPNLANVHGVCRPITGLVGTGPWTPTTGANANLPNHGAGPPNGANVDAVCAAGDTAAGYTVSVTSNPYVARIQVACATPTQSAMGVTTLPAAGLVPSVGSGGTARPAQACAAGSVATGVLGRSGAVNDSFSMRCSPMVIR